MSRKVFVEQAHADDPKQIVKATQKGLLDMMTHVVNQTEKDSKAPGLTWDQIRAFIDFMQKKEPFIAEDEKDIPSAEFDA